MTDLETLPQSTVPEETDLVMTLAGADAIHFLQGQTTADFENTEPGAVRFAAFCNPKGRVIADVLAIVVSNEEVMLRGRQAVMTALATHLKPYLSFSKSTLSDSHWRISCEKIGAQRSATEHAARLQYDADTLVRIDIPRSDDITESWRVSGTAAHSQDSGAPRFS